MTATARDLYRLARRYQRLSPAHTAQRRAFRDQTGRQLSELAWPRLRAEGLLMKPRVEQIARLFAARLRDGVRVEPIVTRDDALQARAATASRLSPPGSSCQHRIPIAGRGQ